MEILDNLNIQQIKAVKCTKGPLLVLAGAGSGKTRVITRRIAYLIEEIGIKPWNILAITFTNKAAREMKERVSSILGGMSDSIWISTFHSTCVRILRRDIEYIGYEKNFDIFDTQDQKTVYSDCLKELKYNKKNFPERMVLSEISSAKNNLVDYKEYRKKNEYDFRLKKIADIYELYQKKLIKNNALDFDDLIMQTVALFEKNPDILEYYQDRFQYILIDEYQDTNKAQYKLASLLAAKHKNLCVVGDDDQSIYGWRGANIRNILDFEKEFKKCTVIRLEQNYRSTKNILEAANNVIRNNEGRKKKKLWTEGIEGSKISVYRAFDEHDEADYIVDIIRKGINENRKLKDYAVLYRMNAQSRVIEDTLVKKGIPYRIFGGLKFYDRKEIKDITSYLKLILNSANDVALRRIINVPARGIGASSVEKLEVYAGKNQISLFAAASCADRILGLERRADKILLFVKLINSLKIKEQEMKLSDFIDELIRASGMIDTYQKEDTVESRSRIENIKEFKSVIIEYEKEAEKTGEALTLETFAERVTLSTDMDNLGESPDYVSLLTMHSAKGLEFKVVFIPGCEDGIFPGYQSIFEEKSLEEERRLCYVGITRAKEELYMTNAKARTIFGKTSRNIPSKFLLEIPDVLKEKIDADNINPLFNYKTKTKNNINTLKIDKKLSGLKIMKGGKPYVIGNKNKIALPEEKPLLNPDIGDRVKHKKFGSGTVEKITGTGEDAKIEINFDNFGMKRLMVAYANLIRE